MSESITKLKEQLKELQDQDNKITNKIYELERKIDVLKVQEVLSKGYLNDDIWILDYSQIYISLSCNDTHKFKRLRDVLETDYHCNINITDHINLNFSDGDMCITFADIATGIKFIKEHQIKNLDVSDLKNHIENLEVSLEGFIKLSNEINEVI